MQSYRISELRAYKPPPSKLSDSEGHVQKFVAPKAPRVLDEGDIARDLKAYEDQQVEIEGQEAEEKKDPWENFFEDMEEDEDRSSH
ncbi:MAG: hypothetical protein Q9190_001591 [Brigantiaea leucoxantha]